MKNLLLLCFVLLSAIGFSQDEFQKHEKGEVIFGSAYAGLMMTKYSGHYSFLHQNMDYPALALSSVLIIPVEEFDALYNNLVKAFGMSSGETGAFNMGETKFSCVMSSELGIKVLGVHY